MKIGVIFMPELYFGGGVYKLRVTISIPEKYKVLL
jgi:hypothetical protein